MNHVDGLDCLVCLGPVVISLTRKGNGLFLRCQTDGRHFRGFIMDQNFVDGVLRRAEDLNR